MFKAGVINIKIKFNLYRDMLNIAHLKINSIPIAQIVCLMEENKNIKK